MQKTKTGFRVPIDDMGPVDCGTPSGIYVNVLTDRLRIHYSGLEDQGDPIIIPANPGALREFADALLEVASFWESYQRNAVIRW
jgi:hypothetical protein